MQIAQVQNNNICVASDGAYTQWTSLYSQCGSAVADTLTNSYIWVSLLNWTTRLDDWTEFLGDCCKLQL